MKIHDPWVCIPPPTAAPSAAPERPERAAACAGPGADPREAVPERTDASHARARTATTLLRGAATTTGTRAQPSMAQRTLDAGSGSACDDPGEAIPAVTGAAPAPAQPGGPPGQTSPEAAAAPAHAARSQASGATDPPAPPPKNQPPPEPPAPLAPRRSDLAVVLKWALGVWIVVALAMLLVQVFSSKGSQPGWGNTPEAIGLQQREKQQEVPDPH